MNLLLMHSGSLGYFTPNACVCVFFIYLPAVDPHLVNE